MPPSAGARKISQVRRFYVVMTWLARVLMVVLAAFAALMLIGAFIERGAGNVVFFIAMALVGTGGAFLTRSATRRNHALVRQLVELERNAR